MRTTLAVARIKIKTAENRFNAKRTICNRSHKQKWKTRKNFGESKICKKSD